MNHERSGLTDREQRLYGHQIERAEFRYGLTLSPSDLRTLAQKILRREGTHLHDLPDTRTGGRCLDGARQAWKVNYLGKTMICVFRTSVNEVVTFLPAQQEFHSNGQQRGNVRGR